MHVALTWFFGTTRILKSASQQPGTSFFGLKDLKKPLEKAKAQVRAWVEHLCHVIKNLFRHRKARYRGLAKNQPQLYSLFALANLTHAKRSLLGATRA